MKDNTQQPPTPASVEQTAKAHALKEHGEGEAFEPDRQQSVKDFLAGYASKPSGMRWVKASEELPPIGKKVSVRVYSNNNDNPELDSGMYDGDELRGGKLISKNPPRRIWRVSNLCLKGRMAGRNRNPIQREAIQGGAGKDNPIIPYGKLS